VWSSIGEQCFGGKEVTAWSPYPELTQFCTGNNHGSWEFYDANDKKYGGGNFSAGFARDYPNGYYIVSLKITGWSGNDKC
jgi:hypothetical protein